MSAVWQRAPFSLLPLERKSWRWREAEQECIQRFMARGEIDYAHHWPWCALGICPPPDSSACYTYTHTQYGQLHSRQKIQEITSRSFWTEYRLCHHLICRQTLFLSLFRQSPSFKKNKQKKHLESVVSSRSVQGFVPTVCVVSNDGCFIPLATEGSDRLLMDGCCGMARKDGAARFPWDCSTSVCVSFPCVSQVWVKELN